MSELFGTTPENVLMHLQNVYASGVLQEEATTTEFLVVRQEGKRQVRRRLKNYNLDGVTSIGYRANSKQGTQFRIWANQVLKDYLVQGYALNKQRLSQQQSHIQEPEKTLKSYQKLKQNS